MSMAKFRVGLSPDFYTDAKGKFEEVIEEHLGAAEDVELRPDAGSTGQDSDTGRARSVRRDYLA